MTCPAAEEISAPPASPAPPIAADDSFFVDHPDLKDEVEIVNKASKALAAEGYKTGTAKEASDALAAESRVLLDERTPEEWQQKAVSLFPELGVAGSKLNSLFLKHYRELQAKSPAFAEEPSWPVLLAKRCNDELRAGSQPASGTILALPPVTKAQSSRSNDKRPPGQTHRSAHFWQTAFALVLLILLTAGPAGLVFWKAQMRKRSSGGRPPLWQITVKHAAIIYLAVALPTSVYSLAANSDLGFADRVFVSLLAGTLFGLFITLPIGGMDALWRACQKHAARPATR
jgi:hypothetical protein